MKTEICLGKERREARGEVISTRAPELVLVKIPDLEMKLFIRSRPYGSFQFVDVIVSLAAYLLAFLP